MPTYFDLTITADYPSRTAEFRLRDALGSPLAARQTDFKSIAASRLQGLFDLRNYLRLYVEEGKEAAAVAEIGVCIAEEVLGQDIFERLWESEAQRTLRIRLPGQGETKNHLAAALARVPWEIARPASHKPTLGERNLLVRVVYAMDEPASRPLDLAHEGPLRVLFVFAEARGSRPLGARQERRELLRLFEREIYPRRRVVAHFLTHGVTRERLEDQIAQNGGYHVVHWSGHGHLNLLDLCKRGGASDHLSGDELLDLFTDAGGFLPRLAFLSACHSGDIVIKDWNDFLEVKNNSEPRMWETVTREIDLKQRPGLIGTAHALLKGGIPSVIAMRYTVSDDYARELAVEFYRALLAHEEPKNAAAALTLARRAMLDARKHDPARFTACDHATPVLYGAEQPALNLKKGRSPESNPRDPRLHAVAEFTAAQHEHFVGRTWELAGLGSDFIGSSAGAAVKPVAIITGLGGMGKTALLAEAVALWERRFEWVLLYQAKPNPLGFVATLRDIDLKLRGELKLYYSHVKKNPADAIYRDDSEGFSGRERFERLTRNLIRAMKDEPILLVLDNFEANLKQTAEAAPAAEQPVWACEDSAWDDCLSSLARHLVSSPSRVLITSRKPLAALVGERSYPVLLGPLPPPEARLYVKQHPVLSSMVGGYDASEKALGLRLLNASRFHPLLMDRLARLAAAPALREQLLQALDTLEKTKDFARLPALFANKRGDASDLAYLDDALTTSLDQLIRDAGAEARRLLWLIAVANEPVGLARLRRVWRGNRHDQNATMRTPPRLDPLLRYIVGVGLATDGRAGTKEHEKEFTCHELVRERISVWMEQMPKDQGELTANVIRLAYAECLEASFKSLLHSDMTGALEAGLSALRYYVQVGAHDRLGDFASDVVTSTRDPRLLEELVPQLQTAAESAPDGAPRRKCIRAFADALRNLGRPDASLRFYCQAAKLTRAAVDADSTSAEQAWIELAKVLGSGAVAFRRSGDIDSARRWYSEAIEASHRGGRPLIHAVSNELEILRLEVIQGSVDEAWPRVEARLDQLKKWWQCFRNGNAVPEAPDPEFLARALIGALDVAWQADCARKQWESALSRVAEISEVRRTRNRPEFEGLIDRFNRAIVLVEIPDRSEEALAELEDLYLHFRNRLDWRAKALNCLADLFSKQGDWEGAIEQQRRALALCENLPDPADRATSHNNLASYLRHCGTAAAFAEALRHQLAAFIYRRESKLTRDLENSISGLVDYIRCAHAAGADVVEPRLAELLANSAFRPLEEWLRQREVNVVELQVAVDQLLQQTNEAATERS